MQLSLRFKVTDQGLLIQNVDVTDNAVYKCEARSQVSHEDASATLNVDGESRVNPPSFHFRISQVL